MPSSTAVIIGAGVIGLSTAYHLAQKHFGRVIVLDKGPVGDGSSSRAAGIITCLLWSETGVRARVKSLELYRELCQDLEGYRFQQVGCLNLFDALGWIERATLLPLYRRLGVTFEILDATDMRRRWPAIQPDLRTVGLFDPLGGYSEPADYLPALAAKNRQLGVEIHEHKPVTQIVVEGGRARGVQTPQGFIAADAVICTVHVWMQKLLAALNLRVPVKAFVHQRYVTSPLAAPPPIPAINANPLAGYVRPAAGGRLLLGIETPARAEFRVPAPDFHMSALSAPVELKETIRHNFTSFLPALAQTKWEDEKVGLIAFSVDGEPILGPVKQIPGLYLGCAFHSGGFAYNPVAGLLLAEYVAEGQTGLDVSAFSPDRFAAADVDAYLATSVPQSQAVRRRH